MGKRVGGRDRDCKTIEKEGDWKKMSLAEHETSNSAVDSALADVLMSSGERALFAAEWSREDISETRNWGREGSVIQLCQMML